VFQAAQEQHPLSERITQFGLFNYADFVLAYKAIQHIEEKEKPQKHDISTPNPV